ncbi:unnamed protein product, partial [Didymodactylos carnosus]
ILSGGYECAILDHVLINASAALVITGRAKDFRDGVVIARESINNGKALQTMNDYIKYTQEYGSSLQITAQNYGQLVPIANQTLSVDSNNKACNICATSTLPYVKICGLCTVDDALAAAKAGADLIGFIFVKKSKRYVSVEIVKAISAALKAGSWSKCEEVESISVIDWHQQRCLNLIQLINHTNRPLLVGVFMNNDIKEINSIVKEAGLDLVQLHNYEHEIATQIHRPVIRVISIEPTTDVQNILQMIESDSASAAILLDVVKTSDDCGQTFDWTIAKMINKKVPIMLAGGLTPDNIRAAVRFVHPWAVDVASGVEYVDSSEQLCKNHIKIKEFINEAKSGAASNQ